MKEGGWRKREREVGEVGEVITYGRRSGTNGAGCDAIRTRHKGEAERGRVRQRGKRESEAEREEGERVRG